MNVSATFPRTRLRRPRMADWSRRLVAEHHLCVDDLIWPIFVAEREQDCGAVATMPGVSRLNLAQAIAAAQEAHALGICAIALFPCTPLDKKSDDAREALNSDNLVCRTVQAIKAVVPEIGIICDVALDPYTSHGHDGLLVRGEVDNDATVAMLCQQAVVQAAAGCDVVAPSDMMDGRIGAIRDALDVAGFQHTLILSYAVKYASAFYGPFRDAVGSKSALGKADKRTYQMDPANRIEGWREAALDVAEGADWLMVKPGMPYLDIIRDVSSAHDVPVMAYQVSGEYAAIAFAAQAGALDYQAAMMESLLAFKRAGATAIFTYAAYDVAQWLRNEELGARG